MRKKGEERGGGRKRTGCLPGKKSFCPQRAPGLGKKSRHLRVRSGGGFAQRAPKRTAARGIKDPLGAGSSLSILMSELPEGASARSRNDEQTTRKLLRRTTVGMGKEARH